MPIWRRQRKGAARKFARFDRTKLPEPEPLTFEESFAEGLLVAEAAARMALKNRIIVMALRGEESFDPERAADAAREVLQELEREMGQVAEWSAHEREEAAFREGRARHQHDYHSSDARNLRLRERVNEAVSKRLTELSGDADYLASMAERARDDAWHEIAEVIEQRLAREWPQFEIDEAYERERDERMRDVSRDLERDLRAVVSRRETRDELDDTFGTW